MAELPLTLYQGDSVIYRLSLTDPDGAPLLFTGSVVEFTIKLRASDATPIVSKSSARYNEVNIRSAPNDNQADVLLSHIDTESITPGTYLYDARMTIPGGLVYTIVSGIMSVLRPLS